MNWEIFSSMSIVILQFFIYSFMGWCVQTIYYSSKNSHFVNCGYFFGPILPVYGAWSVITYVSTRGVCKTPLQYLFTFLISAISYAILKHMADHYTEVVLHVRWNRLKDCTFTLPKMLLVIEPVIFGVLGIILIKRINPIILSFVYWLPDFWVRFLSITFIVAFVFDVLVSNLIVRKSARIFFLSACGILILAIAGGSYAYYVTAYRAANEPETTATSTNIDPIYPATYLENFLVTYDLMDNYDVEERSGSYVIPGLKATETIPIGRLGKQGICTSMTPQGLAVTEDYLFISAYCYTRTHHSVIYMLNRHTGVLEKELVLDGKPHAGGLAYDDIHRILWVSGYQEDTAYVNAISMDTIERYSLHDEYQPIEYLAKYPLVSITRNSYMTFSNGSLYIGHYDSQSDTVVERYPVDNKGLLQYNWLSSEGEESIYPLYTATISTRTQGYAMFEDHVFLSKSYGMLPSSLMAFDTSAQDDQFISFTEDQAKLSAMMPPGMEQICVWDNKVYVLFESAAYAYRSFPEQHIDRVIIIDLKELK